jgi:lactate dehydrogenase-like 2-hydroxyacid dehydrogenase
VVYDSGVKLDVWEQELPSGDSPLRTSANAVAVFHAAGVCHEGRGNIATKSAEQFAHVGARRKPPMPLWRSIR